MNQSINYFINSKRNEVRNKKDDLSESSLESRGEVKVEDGVEEEEEEQVEDEEEGLDEVVSTLRSTSGDVFFGRVRKGTLGGVTSFSRRWVVCVDGWYVAASGCESLFSSSLFSMRGESFFDLNWLESVLATVALQRKKIFCIIYKHFTLVSVCVDRTR